MSQKLVDNSIFRKKPPIMTQEQEVITHKKALALRRLSVAKAALPGILKHLDVPTLDPCPPPDRNILKDIYWTLNRELSRKNLETQRTHAETRFYELLSQHSVKTIYRSLWIGSYCVDFFIPNIRQITKFTEPEIVGRGLSIEIDGDSHNYEPKMRKDELRDIELLKLGILTTRIQNWDFKEQTVIKLLKSISALRPLDSRERKRMWTRIYAYTLAIHLDDEDFFQIFKLTNKKKGE